MAKAVKSAGVLAFRKQGATLEVLLVHPGGPFWRNKDIGAWSIPKGEFNDTEDAETAARREFSEEIGIALAGPLIPLGEIRQRAGKTVIAFTTEIDVDVGQIESNTFEIEWPPRSGRRQTFPEIDRAEWFQPDAARQKINAAQVPFLERLQAVVRES